MPVTGEAFCSPKGYLHSAHPVNMLDKVLLVCNIDVLIISRNNTVCLNNTGLTQKLESHELAPLPHVAPRSYKIKTSLSVAGIRCEAWLV